MNQAFGMFIYEDMREGVVCPKPLSLNFRHHLDPSESKARKDLLDIIYPKGGQVAEQSYPQEASPPPFFSGSPPSRVSNPLIRDSSFGDSNFYPISPHPIPIPSGLPRPHHHPLKWEVVFRPVLETTQL